MLASHCVKFTRCTGIIILKKYNLFKNVAPVTGFYKDLRNSNKLQQTNYSTNKYNARNHTVLNLLKDETRLKKTVSSEEVLEKLIAGLSSDIHQKNRVYKNDFMRVLSKVKEGNFSTKKQGLLLLNCCTQLLADETPGTRLELAEEVWKSIKPHTKLTVDHYNELLKVYIDNEKHFNVSSFIEQMAPLKPSITTYELILRALGEVGDINRATEVISNMKTQGIAATESVFNSLIICQGKARSIDSIQEVLTMMKSLKLAYSVSTYTMTARAYAWNRKDDLMFDVMDKAVTSGITFGETHIMKIVKTLAAAGNYRVIPKVLKYLPQATLNTPSISAYMQSVCTQLVFQNHPTAALEIYKCLPLPSFGPKDDKGLHGRSLIRDCVKAMLPYNIIGLVAEELVTSGRNPVAMQNATEAALQQGKSPLALDLFSRMKQLGMPLRPHYFWPILLKSSNTYGEKGIMNTLSTMVAMDVKPDYETIMEYTLPFVSFTSPQNLMKKFLEAGLTVTSVLTPMMVTLLNTGQVRAASEICELFVGKVDVEIVLKSLVKGYFISSDVKSTVHILEDMTSKASDKSRDWVGRFLCELVRHKKIAYDLTDFLAVIKAIESTDLKISSAAVDYCLTRLPQKYSAAVRDSVSDALGQITDERLADDGDLFVQQMPHPKQMNEVALKSHLTELEAKGMNTRGVLRKLLQQYCREGNLAAAREVVEKCRQEDVFLSAGMKASIFDLHVKLGELEQAEMALADLYKSAPNFTLDEHKVIDFATLMVYRHKIDRAYALISEQARNRRVVGGSNISRNCWRLLDAVAANSPADVRRMFELLTSARYCRPSNTLLGPFIRAHLNSNDTEKAVEEFVYLSKKYNKTPLKHELLCRVLCDAGEKGAEAELSAQKGAVQTILGIDKEVHGTGSVQLTLIAALAEVGYKKILRKLFLEPTFKIHPDALMRRCERFADEKKVDALQAIAECTRGLRHVDVPQLYDLILDVYQRDDNCEEALSLWYGMQECDVSPTQRFVRTLCALCTANKRRAPVELARLDRQLTV